MQGGLNNTTGNNSVHVISLKTELQNRVSNSSQTQILKHTHIYTRQARFSFYVAWPKVGITSLQEFSVYTSYSIKQNKHLATKAKSNIIKHQT